jgi:hypothetical protein
MLQFSAVKLTNQKIIDSYCHIGSDKGWTLSSSCFELKRTNTEGLSLGCRGNNDLP